MDDDADEDDSNLHIAEKDDASSLTQEEMEELDKQDERLEAAAAAATTPSYEDEAKKEEEDVRQSAEKLLAWASYRSNMSSRNSRSGSQRSHNGDHDHSSVLSPSVLTSGSARQSLLGKMIETMEDDEESQETPLKTMEHFEEKKEDDALGIGSLAIDGN
jgi:hypothetical protein